MSQTRMINPIEDGYIEVKYIASTYIYSWYGTDSEMYARTEANKRNKSRIFLTFYTGDLVNASIESAYIRLKFTALGDQDSIKILKSNHSNPITESDFNTIDRNNSFISPETYTFSGNYQYYDIPISDLNLINKTGYTKIAIISSIDTGDHTTIINQNTKTNMYANESMYCPELIVIGNNLGIFTKKQGEIKAAKGGFVKSNDIWVPIKKLYVKTNNIWQETGFNFSNLIDNLPLEIYDTPIIRIINDKTVTVYPRYLETPIENIIKIYAEITFTSSSSTVFEIYTSPIESVDWDDYVGTGITLSPKMIQTRELSKNISKRKIKMYCLMPESASNIDYSFNIKSAWKYI